MVVLAEELGKYLGRTVQTPYGTPAGKLIGLDTNIRNEVTQINVDQASGELAKYPIAQLNMQNGSIVLLPPWKDEAADLAREHLTAVKRMGALKSLLTDGDIDDSTYREMTSEYESAIHAMESRRIALVDSLKERSGKLDERIRVLQLALTDNKLLFSSGVVEAGTYKEACQAIHEMLDGHVAEKKDVQATIEALAHLEDQGSSQLPIKPQQTEQRVPDFVVVRVNEKTPA